MLMGLQVSGDFVSCEEDVDTDSGRESMLTGYGKKRKRSENDEGNVDIVEEGKRKKAVNDEENVAEGNKAEIELLSEQFS